MTFIHDRLRSLLNALSHRLKYIFNQPQYGRLAKAITKTLDADSEQY
jgi:hypothetical protein